MGVRKPLQRVGKSPFGVFPKEVRRFAEKKDLKTEQMAIYKKLVKGTGNASTAFMLYKRLSQLEKYMESGAALNRFRGFVDLPPKTLAKLSVLDIKVIDTLVFINKDGLIGLSNLSESKLKRLTGGELRRLSILGGKNLSRLAVLPVEKLSKLSLLGKDTIQTYSETSGVGATLKIIGNLPTNVVSHLSGLLTSQLHRLAVLPREKLIQLSVLPVDKLSRVAMVDLGTLSKLSKLDIEKIRNMPNKNIVPFLKRKFKR